MQEENQCGISVACGQYGGHSPGVVELATLELVVELVVGYSGAGWPITWHASSAFSLAMVVVVDPAWVSRVCRHLIRGMGFSCSRSCSLVFTWPSAISLAVVICVGGPCTRSRGFRGRGVQQSDMTIL